MHRQSQLIARAPTGHRCGECHQKAVLSDAQVRSMRADREMGMSLRALAMAYGCGLSTARDICDYATRYSA
ncbi:hypothetical protein [Vreelandella titanicae]|uniref:hypothetical protein n=1 Tax=Vreelandella titanicae TaxID=664683 RepID=UPI00382D1689